MTIEQYGLAILNESVDSMADAQAGLQLCWSLLFKETFRTTPLINITSSLFCRSKRFQITVPGFPVTSPELYRV
ncbi:hypothetical protein DPMN_002480 [Dreissena polymorpha]|uniref:Uncharacterized protein n=1 Tax=Dreissena polymorpha TaxID=45954 RepID=A0A9D4MK62_DREPO|nr:hypothetical protein DPMN_002480 [Dreissena polymorpha]